MNRFLICCGTYGQGTALDYLEYLVRSRQPDGVLFAGGVLPRARRFKPGATSTYGYTNRDAFFVERFFSVLGRLRVFTAIIPGVFDAPLDLFLRAGMKAELEYPYLHVVHTTPSTEKDVAVFGLGVCINGYTDTEIGYYSRTLAMYYLRPMWTCPQPHKVLLLPSPPNCWEGHTGATHLADPLITTYRPELCVIGNTCGTPTVERLASTLIVTPGDLADGSAAWLDRSRHPTHQVELLQSDCRTTERPLEDVCSAHS